MATRTTVLLLSAVVLLAGCGAASTQDVGSGGAMSDLAPTYDPRTADGAGSLDDSAERAGPDAVSAGRGDGRDDREEEAGSATAAPASPALEPAPERRSSPTVRARRTKPAAATPTSVRIDDPTGDLSRSIEGAPASADIVAVELSRTGDTIEVRTTFAADVPTRQSGDKAMNVASFYDVDGNGVVDYEVWASLADDGWGTGHLDRREERATFGPSTGIEISVQGRTLVAGFPADRVGGAQRFRWSAASEWGSYEAMAASTSARDYAPDSGAVDFPG